MTVREYLHSADIDAARLAEILGYKTKGTVTKRLDEEMPTRWSRKLEELADLGISPIGAATDEIKADDSEARDQPLISDEAINEWINTDGREGDRDPNLKEKGFEVIGPQQIKLSTVKGYLEMIYGGAEAIARSRGDEIAAETIHRYTPEYVEAWIDYIKFDSRILEYFEKLQIGTPIGNLIGVHAISIGAYTLARITAKEIAAQAAQNGDGEIEH